MIDDDKIVAEDLILKNLNKQKAVMTKASPLLQNSIQRAAHHPIDSFLAECGFATKTSTPTSNTNRARSIKEELTFYTSNAEKSMSFEQFWNKYQGDLPLLVTLVREYNIRPATSVASEGLFSVAGYVQRKQRSSLSPETLRYSMILRDQKLLASLL